MPDLIAIPDNLEHTLGRDPALHGGVLATLKLFQPWLRTSGMPFFPGYTDHSDIHISQVLATASSIMTDQARDLLSASDVAVLILSALLHDIGMHTTADGFRAMVGGAYSPTLFNAHFGDLPWPKLWSDFLGEASRFDGRRLVQIFGTNSPVDPSRVDLDNLTERDHLLIGEFLRRHHARLAHQIAVSGVPGPSSVSINASQYFDEELLDLAGLVARSHNLSLRDTFAFLEERYDRREFRNIRSIFLMVVLRIADYFQVQSERAPKELLKVKQLKSPISRREWRIHHAIRDFRSSNDDPEAIFIDALPKDIQSYARLKHLLKDIQHELDASWAVLGEVFGRVSPLNDLGLTVRRVRSTLDDVGSLSKKLPFIPLTAAFEASGADLLRLLVGPLYSDNPSVAIRELLQNAVDACRELADIQKTPPASEPGVPDVEIVLDRSKGKHGNLLIRDRGIGMSLDVVVNYFLKAGASYRHSEAWRRQHEDEKGKSRILRGGRFGVGALAAFLIGDRIDVSTRRFDAPTSEGIHFSGELDSSELELKRIQLETGTTISIDLRDEETWQTLVGDDIFSVHEDWQQYRLDDLAWYRSSWPNVRLLVRGRHGEEIPVKPGYLVPEPGSELPQGWHRIHDPEYRDIQWTFDYGAPKLTCNGILVMERTNRYVPSPDQLWGDWRTPIQIERPNLSIFDPQGVLPLNLQRDGLAASRLSFDDALSNSVALDVVASAYGKLPPSCAALTRETLKHDAIPSSRHVAPNILITQKGVVWLEPSVINSAGLTKIWIVPSFKEMLLAYGLLPDGSVGILPLNSDPNSSDKFRLLLYPSAYGSQPIEVLGTDQEIAPLSKSEFESVKRPRAVRKDLISSIETESVGDVLIAYGRGMVPRANVDEFIGLLAKYNKAGGSWIAQWSLTEVTKGTNVEASPVAKAWLEISGDGVVPFDEATRETHIKARGDLFRAYVKHHTGK